jgi:hypothetical protein
LTHRPEGCSKSGSSSHCVLPSSQCGLRFI